MNNNENNSIRYPNQFDLTAWGTLIGGMAVLGLVIFSVIFPPEASSADQAVSVTIYLSNLQEFDTQILIITILDTIFIAGYLSLFIGLWLIIRDFGEAFSRIPLFLGILVALGDIFENALIFLLVHGVSNGWDPHPIVFAIVWTTNIFIDILSYVAAILFAVFYLTIWKPPSPKFVLGLLLVLYAIVGLTSLIFVSLALVRSFLFILGLGFGAYVLFKEETIPLEDLERLLHQSEQKSDYIR